MCTDGRKISNMTGGATWSKIYMHTHLGDIVYKFEGNRVKTLGEIAIFGKCERTDVNGRKIANMTGDATWSTICMHTHLVDIVYKFE